MSNANRVDELIKSKKKEGTFQSSNVKGLTEKELREFVKSAFPEGNTSGLAAIMKSLKKHL